MIKLIIFSFMIYISLFYNATFDNEKMIFYSIPEEFGNVKIYICILILLMLIAITKLSYLRLYTIDILFIMFTILFIIITIKNYYLINTSHLRTTLFYPYFYFIGRLIYFLKQINIRTLTNILYTAAIVHIFVSILKIISEYYLLGPSLMFIGSRISGSEYLGSFTGRACGLFYSPLTFSSFLVLPFFLCIYSAIYDKKIYKYILLILFIGVIISLSRGTVIAILFGIIILIYLKFMKKYHTIIRKKYIMRIFILLILAPMFVSIFIDTNRLYNSKNVSKSVGNRVDVISNDILIYFADWRNLLFGSTNLSIGSDNDFITLLFTIGIPSMALLCLIIFKLTYDIISINKFTIFFVVGVIAKALESNFAGSTWGPPTSFYIFILLGYLYSEKIEIMRRKQLPIY